MNPWIELTLGVITAVLGLGYLYRPDIIARMNSFLRDYLFNDAHMALERKKWGAFFLMMGFLLLYMGYTALLNQ